MYKYYINKARVAGRPSYIIRLITPEAGQWSYKWVIDGAGANWITPKYGCEEDRSCRVSLLELTLREPDFVD